MIVIAIDHGEKDRITEYTPFVQTKFGPGDAWAAITPNNVSRYASNIKDLP